MQLRLSQAARLALRKRAQQIIGHIQKGEITASELLESIATPPAMVAEKAEDLALSWILRGFLHPTTTWVRYSILPVAAADVDATARRSPAMEGRLGAHNHCFLQNLSCFGRSPGSF